MALHIPSIRLLTFVLSICLQFTFVLTAPRPLFHKSSIRHATHRTRNLPRASTLHSYHPISSYEVSHIRVDICVRVLNDLWKTYGSGLSHPLSNRDDVTLQDAAAAFVQSRLGVQSHSVFVQSAFEGEVTKHAYIKQRINNLTVANAVANVAFNQANEVVAFGSSFVPDGWFSSRLLRLSRLKP